MCFKVNCAVNVEVISLSFIINNQSYNCDSFYFREDDGKVWVTFRNDGKLCAVTLFFFFRNTFALDGWEVYLDAGLSSAMDHSNHFLE